MHDIIYPRTNFSMVECTRDQYINCAQHQSLVSIGFYIPINKSIQFVCFVRDSRSSNMKNFLGLLLLIGCVYMIVSYMDFQTCIRFE